MERASPRKDASAPGAKEAEDEPAIEDKVMPLPAALPAGRRPRNRDSRSSPAARELKDSAHDSHVPRGSTGGGGGGTGDRPVVVMDSGGADEEALKILLDQISKRSEATELTEKASLVAKVLALAHATSQRLAPPGTAAVEHIKSVCLQWMRAGKSIPVLIAASGCKLPFPSYPCDMAELLFLKQLRKLQGLITQVYPPGLDVHVRLEDATVLVLLQDVEPHLQRHVNDYCRKVEVLVSDTPLRHFVTIKRETDLMSMFEFADQVRRMAQVVHRFYNAHSELARRVAEEEAKKEAETEAATTSAVTEPKPHAEASATAESSSTARAEGATGSAVDATAAGGAGGRTPTHGDAGAAAAGRGVWARLSDELTAVESGQARMSPEELEKEKAAADKEAREMGWAGGLSVQQYERQRETYARLYSHWPPGMHERKIAHYFACILARRKLRGYGNDPAWKEHGGHIDIGVTKPLPDSLPSQNRIHMRSLDVKVMGAQTLPFWCMIVGKHRRGNTLEALPLDGNVVAVLARDRRKAEALARGKGKGKGKGAAAEVTLFRHCVEHDLSVLTLN